MGMEHMFNLSFTIFPIFFMIIFGLIVVIIAVTIVRGLSQWRKNNNSPVLAVEASVVTKRADVRHHSHVDAGDAGMSHSSSTTYYATFEVESGDRMELLIPRNEYGMLVEGDRGKLTFQGTRFLGFERAR